MTLGRLPLTAEGSSKRRWPSSARRSPTSRRSSPTKDGCGQVIKDELGKIREGSSPRAHVAARSAFDTGDMNIEDLVDDEDLIVTLSAKGYVK